MAQLMLIDTIITMMLISIQPFALRKMFLIIVALLCFSALCMADPLLMAQRYGSGSRHLPTAGPGRSEAAQGLPLAGLDQVQLSQVEQSVPELLSLGRQVKDVFSSGNRVPVFQRAKCVLRADSSKSFEEDEILIYTGKV